MIHPKVLGLLVIVAASVAMASTADATTLTSPSGTTYTGHLKATSEGHVSIHNQWIPNIECHWAFDVAQESSGPGVTVVGHFEELTVTGCTDEWKANVQVIGSATIHAIHGGPDGTLIWGPTTISFTHPLYGTCRYTINESAFRLTSSQTTGGAATLDIAGGISFHSGSFLCQKPAEWTGSVQITSPETLNVDTPPTIHAATTEPSTFHNENGEPITKCSSTIESDVEADGPTITAGGQVTSLTFSECSGGWAVTAIEPGTLEMHPIGGGPDGTLTLSGATLKLNVGGFVCYYNTTNTDIGTFTGSSTTSGTARLDIDVSLPFHSGGFPCPEQLPWTGSYLVNDVLDF